MNEPASTATYWANIYIGLHPGYENRTQPPQVAVDMIQAYVDAKGLCVTLTPTSLIYTNGNEPGFIIGLINYPRFPSTPEKIKEHAMALAEMLKDSLGQFRVSVMFPNETVMLGDAT